jgi:PadR family transcriptional regulator, regulatory protein PadR
MGYRMARLTLQHFELQVLLAMLRGGGETYSVPLVVALEKRTGRPVAQAAVFIALSRLEKKGLVTSRLEEPHAGRARRYFKLSREGLAAVREQHLEHARLWKGLGGILRTRKV